MSLNRVVSIVTYAGLALQSAIYSIRKHAPFAKPRSFPLLEQQRDIIKSNSITYKALSENFIPQFSASSCSVASTAIVLNAARTTMGLMSNGNRISQSEILDKSNALHWKERVSRKGYQGRRGLPIEILGTAIESSFRNFDVPCKEISTIPLSAGSKNLHLRKKELLSRLIAFDKKADSFIVAHFNQGIFIRGLHLPHISPVGAFDPKLQRLLILDVDPDQHSPYWVSFDTFFEGVCWGYGGILKKYGYTGGGYVWIRPGK